MPSAIHVFAPQLRKIEVASSALTNHPDPSQASLQDIDEGLAAALEILESPEALEIRTELATRFMSSVQTLLNARVGNVALRQSLAKVASEFLTTQHEMYGSSAHRVPGASVLVAQTKSVLAETHLAQRDMSITSQLINMEVNALTHLKEAQTLYLARPELSTFGKFVDSLRGLFGGKTAQARFIKSANATLAAYAESHEDELCALFTRVSPDVVMDGLRDIVKESNPELAHPENTEAREELTHMMFVGLRDGVREERFASYLRTSSEVAAPFHATIDAIKIQIASSPDTVVGEVQKSIDDLYMRMRDDHAMTPEDLRSIAADLRDVQHVLWTRMGLVANRQQLSTEAMDRFRQRIEQTAHVNTSASEVMWQQALETLDGMAEEITLDPHLLEKDAVIIEDHRAKITGGLHATLRASLSARHGILGQASSLAVSADVDTATLTEAVGALRALRDKASALSGILDEHRAQAMEGVDKLYESHAARLAQATDTADAFHKELKGIDHDLALGKIKTSKALDILVSVENRIKFAPLTRDQRASLAAQVQATMKILGARIEAECKAVGIFKTRIAELSSGFDSDDAMGICRKYDALVEMGSTLKSHPYLSEDAKTLLARTISEAKSRFKGLIPAARKTEFFDKLGPMGRTDLNTLYARGFLDLARREPQMIEMFLTRLVETTGSMRKGEIDPMLHDLVTGDHAMTRLMLGNDLAWENVAVELMTLAARDASNSPQELDEAKQKIELSHALVTTKQHLADTLLRQRALGILPGTKYANSFQALLFDAQTLKALRSLAGEQKLKNIEVLVGNLALMDVAQSTGDIMLKTPEAQKRALEALKVLGLEGRDFEEIQRTARQGFSSFGAVRDTLQVIDVFAKKFGDSSLAVDLFKKAIESTPRFKAEKTLGVIMQNVTHARSAAQMGLHSEVVAGAFGETLLASKTGIAKHFLSLNTLGDRLEVLQREHQQALDALDSLNTALGETRFDEIKKKKSTKGLDSNRLVLEFAALEQLKSTASSSEVASIQRQQDAIRASLSTFSTTDGHRTRGVMKKDSKDADKILVYAASGKPETRVRYLELQREKSRLTSQISMLEKEISSIEKDQNALLAPAKNSIKHVLRAVVLNRFIQEGANVRTFGSMLQKTNEGDAARYAAFHDACMADVAALGLDAKVFKPTIERFFSKLSERGFDESVLVEWGKKEVLTDDVAALEKEILKLRKRSPEIEMMLARQEKQGSVVQLVGGLKEHDKFEIRFGTKLHIEPAIPTDPLGLTDLAAALDLQVDHSMRVQRGLGDRYTVLIKGGVGAGVSVGFGAFLNALSFSAGYSATSTRGIALTFDNAEACQAFLGAVVTGDVPRDALKDVVVVHQVKGRTGETRLGAELKLPKVIPNLPIFDSGSGKWPEGSDSVVFKVLNMGISSSASHRTESMVTRNAQGETRESTITREVSVAIEDQGHVQKIAKLGQKLINVARKKDGEMELAAGVTVERTTSIRQHVAYGILTSASSASRSIMCGRNPAVSMVAGLPRDLTGLPEEDPRTQAIARLAELAEEGDRVVVEYAIHEHAAITINALLRDGKTDKACEMLNDLDANYAPRSIALQTRRELSKEKSLKISAGPVPAGLGVSLFAETSHEETLYSVSLAD